MKRVAVDLFSGLVIPVSFFPGWAEGMLKILPFQAISYLPGSVFTGNIKGAEILPVIGIQLFWFLVLLIPVYVVWQRARKRLFVQGG